MELSINLEILLILLLIIVNGILAMSEIAIVSARQSRLQQWADAGDAKAKAALALANEPNRFLSTVQIGITLVGIFTGAYGGATLAEQLSDALSQFPVLDPYSDALGLGIVVLSITFLSLVMGELVPKRLGMYSPERIAATMAQPMMLMSRIAAPLVALLSFSTDRVLRLFGVKGASEGAITEEEIRVLIQKGTQTGIFEEVEQKMIERMLYLGDRNISSLMTHRSLIEYIDLEEPWEGNLRKIRKVPHSFFPVCQDGLDHVLGIVHVKDLLLQCIEGHEFDLNSALRQPTYVPESMPALKVLESFKKSGNHIALITDEYGVIQGLVTLTDIMEGIVGDIPTEDELANLQAIQREDGSWLLDGMLSVQEFKELLVINELPDEDKGNYQTLGGFAIVQLERIPLPTDVFEWDGWRFEIMDTDGNRVDKVLVQKMRNKSDDSPEE